ncbi:hypothetical protein GTR02_05040 [Kineococcus sp. R8]|uniref:DUF6434 domain-containing protein n=1 Tax=Kineococcus siccus TaxID=2696567 RepID=UPI00141360B4|nr:DUF6434 domain-containing protein [Kineococcus siccus]NAZ81177.1 hypothetical protein [Kineococcus siccus]
MTSAAPARPPATPGLTGAELLRWYWLKEELLTLARTMGVATGGGKQELTARLVAALDGRPVPAPAARSPRRPAALVEPLTAETVILPGQRCTQQVRAWFTAQVGTAFRFDGPVRAAVAAGGTLGEVLEVWRTTRQRPAGEIGAQFELNRFLRAWRADHPGGSHREALDAWAAHRALPREARALHEGQDTGEHV